MKRALLFIFMTVCVLGMSACSSKDAMPETSDSASNPVQNTDISNLNGGKIWSEQDIVSMFSLVQETDWEYIDCVLIPDHASDRVGAVLFRNDKEQTSNVAFFATMSSGKFKKGQALSKKAVFHSACPFLIHVFCLALFETQNYNILDGGAKWII